MGGFFGYFTLLNGLLFFCSACVPLNNTIGAWMGRKGGVVFCLLSRYYYVDLLFFKKKTASKEKPGSWFYSYLFFFHVHTGPVFSY